MLSLQEMKDLPADQQAALAKKIKAARTVAKSTNYAAVYGSGAATLSRTAGFSIQEAEKLLDAYWKLNWSVKKIAEDQTVKTCLGGKWLYNPVSKLWLSLRNERDRFSTLNQSTGVYCFDTWIKNFRKVRSQVTAQIHDEVVLCVKRGNRDKCTALLKNAMTATNQELKLNRELDCDIQYGNSYADIH